jgi:hypothetical protein
MVLYWLVGSKFTLIVYYKCCIKFSKNIFEQTGLGFLNKQVHFIGKVDE